jgi:hypothetical protein
MEDVQVVSDANLRAGPQFRAISCRRLENLSRLKCKIGLVLGGGRLVGRLSWHLQHEYGGGLPLPRGYHRPSSAWKY